MQGFGKLSVRFDVPRMRLEVSGLAREAWIPNEVGGGDVSHSLSIPP
jgi:hypothetical protein